MKYAERNGGVFEGRWECLAQPAACLPGDAGPPLIETDRLHSPRMGYSRELHRGPTAARPPGRSATSIRGFAIVARPESVDGRTFCTDTSGRLCSFRQGEGAMPVEVTREYEGVRCATRCLDLR